MNRELVAAAPGKLEWRDGKEPLPKEGRVVVRPVYGAIKHGTEFSMVSGKAYLRGPWDAQMGLHEKPSPGAAALSGGGPAPGDFREAAVGNMVAGVVEEDRTGTFAPGEWVYGYSPFGHRVAVPPGRLWRLEDRKRWKSLVCLDPARFALGAVRDGGLRLGDRVAVFGLGAIGLLAVQMARLAGAALIVGLDPVTARRDAAAALGADLVLDPRQGDPGRELKRACGGQGPDVVIDFSGTAAALQQVLRGVAFGGTVVCAAFPAPFPAGLDFGAEAHMNRPQIVFSRAGSDPSRDHPRWSGGRIEEECRRLLEEGRLDGSLIVDRVVPYDELKAAFLDVMNDPAAAIKLGVVFPGGEET